MSAQYARWAPYVRHKCAGGHPEPRREHDEDELKRARIQSTSLEAPRRAAAAQLPHEQTEVERGRMDQQSFEDVAVPAQVRAAHPTGVVHMSERPLQVLPASTQQLAAAHAAHPPAIAIDRPLRVRRIPPLAAA